jgi:glycine cleavage system pyridoxal-binding protein P
LKVLGKGGLEQLVDGLCARAKQFAAELEQNGFRILNDVVFNQVLVACATPQQTELTLEKIQQSGILWCGGTSWQGKPAIRISICSWATTAVDVTICVEAFAKARDLASDKK